MRPMPAETPDFYKDVPARANFVRTLYDPVLLSAGLVPLDASHESTAHVNGRLVYE